MPSGPPKKSPKKAEHVNMDLLLGGATDGLESPDSLSPDAFPELKSLEEALSGGISAGADAHLDEVMKAIQSENPELWKEFEAFASSVGTRGGPGEGEEDDEEEVGCEGKAPSDPKSLEAKLEEALHRLRDQQVTKGGGRRGSGRRKGERGGRRKG